jgi:Cytochrome b(C-terminal)/b6/petD
MSEMKNFEAGFGSNATKDPQRIVFITKKTSAKVTGYVGRQLMSYPHVILRETIAFQILTIILVLIALFWNAPLEQLADPLLTPNPAKAPWYFLGLQELLHYFPPVLAGVLIPTLVIIALVVIPYFNVNVKGIPLWSNATKRRFWLLAAILGVLILFFGYYEAWTLIVPTALIGALALISYFLPPNGGKLADFLRSRTVPWWIMTWFIAAAIILTEVGTLFRGPGWSWVWPWR